METSPPPPLYTNSWFSQGIWGHIFKTGRGINEDYKQLSVIAIHSVHNKYNRWPDEDKQKAIAQQIQQKFLSLNCVGLIDGTLNPFTYEPQMEDAADYSGHKYGYSLSTLIVCDDMCHIPYYAAGWPGSVHDN